MEPWWSIFKTKEIDELETKVRIAYSDRHSQLQRMIDQLLDENEKLKKENERLKGEQKE